MAQATLVDKQIVDGSELLDQLAKSGFDVTAACWIKGAPDDYWYLYIASEVVDREGTGSAYHIIHSLIRSNPECQIDPLEVKAVESDSRLAKDIVRMHKKYPKQTPTRYSGSYLGNIVVDEAYIYPPLKLAHS